MTFEIVEEKTCVLDGYA